MLAGTIARAMPVLSAKQMFCGETLPISDFHRAMQMAERNGWIAYSRDHLSIRLA